MGCISVDWPIFIADSKRTGQARPEMRKKNPSNAI
jgi:hypothetical protein